MRRRPRRHRLTTGAAVLLAAAVCSGCSPGAGAFTGPPPQHSSRVVYLDVSDPTTLPPPSPGGVALWRTVAAAVLPRYATVYDAEGLGPFCAAGPAGASGLGCDPTLSASTAGLDALVRLAPPTVVTIESGMAALVAGVPAAAYGRALASLLRRLRGAGARTVLVADLPPANLAAGRIGAAGAVTGASQLAAPIASYDSAIASAASAAGASLVDVHGMLERAARTEGTAAVFGVPGATAGGLYGLTPYAWRLVTRAFVSALRGRVH